METRTCLCHSCDAFSLTRLGLRAFAIGLGDEKGEKELVAGGFDVDLLYGSPETLSSKQWSRQLKEDLLGKQILI